MTNTNTNTNKTLPNNNNDNGQSNKAKHETRKEKSMITRLSLRPTLALALLVTLAFTFITPQLQAQTAIAPRDFGFTFAPDYAKYTLRSTGTIASGASIVTIQADARATTPGGRTFYPLATTIPLLIDQETSANTETVTPTAVSCTQNSLSSTCTFSATFTYSHTGNFTVRSGTFGICEAAKDITSVASGGTVVVPNGFGGTTSTLTTAGAAGACGSATINILDARAGAFQFYTYDGVSAYAASLSPINTTVAANADVTTASGSAFFYTGGRSNATNYSASYVAGSANTAGAKVGYLKTRSTSASGDANTVIVTGDKLGELHAFGADGADFIDTGGIEFVSTGTIAATRVPSNITFYTGTDAAPTVKTLTLTLGGADQSANFVANVYSPNIRSLSTALDATVTTQAPSPRAAFTSAPGTNAELAIAATGASATANQLVAFKTRATTAGAPATTTVVTGDDVLTIRAFGADGTNYVESSQILFDTTGTIAATRVPGAIVFKTGTDAAPTVLTTALTLGADQSASFAGAGTFTGVLTASTTFVSTLNRNSSTALDATVTAAAPAPITANVTAPATNANVAYVSGVASTVGAQLNLFKTRATTAGGPATTTIIAGDDIAQIRGWGADGTNYVESARIELDTSGTIAATRVPGVIRFSTGTDAAPTVLTTALTLNNDQSATFAGIIQAASGGINRASGALALTTTTSGNITLTPVAAATAAVTVPSTRFETAKGATIDSAGASCVSGDCTLGGDGNFFIISNTTAVDGFATAGWQAGSIIVVQTSGSITFNNAGTVAGGFAAMKLVGGANVSMTADDNMMLIYTGSFWDQIAPTLVK